MSVEILFTAWNRLHFTRQSFGLLKRNTDWTLVDRLVVYDDGSEDGTREYLERAGEDIPVPAYELREGGWHSTGATMNDYVALSNAKAFVKIDNDVALPQGWLQRLLAAADAHPEYELIGMEAGWPEYGGTNGALVTRARHIGGVGFMRTRAFHQRKPVPLSLGKNGRAGFTIWQHRHRVSAGWLTPTILAVQLDRIPLEPWRTLAAEYVERGWSRHWDPYEEDMREWWKWMPKRI